MPTVSRAAIVPNRGKALEVVDAEVARPHTGEVRIRNHAVAIQPLDAKMLIADYGGAGSLQYPAVLGASGAGVVEEVGEGVTRFDVGDRVVFDTKAYAKADENRRQGTWQETVIADAKTVAKVSKEHEEKFVVLIGNRLEAPSSSKQYWLTGRYKRQWQRCTYPLEWEPLEVAVVRRKF